MIFRFENMVIPAFYGHSGNVEFTTSETMEVCSGEVVMAKEHDYIGTIKDEADLYFAAYSVTKNIQIECMYNPRRYLEGAKYGDNLAIVPVFVYDPEERKVYSIIITRNPEIVEACKSLNYETLYVVD